MFCPENTDLMRVLKDLLFLIVAVFTFGCGVNRSFLFDWNAIPDRQWVGADFWANRLQDWGIKDHKLFCLRPATLSTLHFLTTEINGDEGFSGTITLGRNAKSMLDSLGKSGLILG